VAERGGKIGLRETREREVKNDKLSDFSSSNYGCIKKKYLMLGNII